MYLRPVDLALRACLEIMAVLGLALGAATVAGGAAGLILAVGLPVAAGATWATFRVPGDPGPAPRPVSGTARLALELLLLGAGALGWLLAGRLLVGVLMAALIVGHHLMTVQRVRWLLRQR